MRVDEVLTTAFEDVGPLRSPVLVLALKGWFDASDAATYALRHLLADRAAPVVASIDADPFFDFTQERPQVQLDEDDQRQIRWPTNDLRLMRGPVGTRDLVVLSGVEPHLRFVTFADCIIEVARRLGCELVVTVGAAAEQVPHTRVPQVVGSSTNDRLVRALGLSRPRYQGVTGLVGVLQERLDRAGIPAVSLRVGVPHYLGNARHPASSAALLRHLEHVLGVPTRHTELRRDIERWRSLHDEAVAEDSQASVYVTMLEAEHDRRTEAALPTADDLAAELERFLREQRDDPGPPSV